MAETGGSEGGGFGAFILPALMGLGTLAGNAMNTPKNRYKWNKKAAEDSNRMNRENQQWMLEQEERLQKEAREYDSPEAQMQRFIAAGLNPNLIYGSGSSAGQAFPIHAGNIPGVQIQAPGPHPDYAGDFIRSAQSMASIGLSQARTGESLMRTQAIELQNEIAKNNPMLNPRVAEAVASALEETSRLKMVESRYWLDKDDGDVAKVGKRINAEIELAMQRLGLNTTDLAIKNKILESKEFENVIKELNAKWMRDSEVTPEHMRQALMLILQRMMR